MLTEKCKVYLQTLFLFFLAFPCFGQVSGSVYRDYNGNGVRDTHEPLLPGITVKAFLANSTSPCGTAITSGSTAPNFTLTGCGTGPVRVEFELPTIGSCVQSNIDFSSFVGSSNGTSIQFVNGNSANVNFGIQHPSDFNLGSTGINVFMPNYVSGDPLPANSQSGDQTFFVGYPYTNTGGSSLKPSQILDGSVIGSTWGVAYSKQAQKVFTSAFLKRHVGLGTLGSGGIYLLSPTATSFNVTSFYDLDANGHRTRAAASAPAYGGGTSYSITSTSIITYLGATDAVSGKPAGLGVIGTNVQRGLSTNPVVPSYDPAAFDQIGKVGLGGLAISDDGKFLYVMNLYSRKVFRLELNDAYNPSSVINVASYDLPATACSNGEFRPFALTFNRNKLYVGVVCSGENNGQNNVGGSTDLYASVFELNNPKATASFNTVPIINQALNYEKGGLDWRVWTNDSDAFVGGNSGHPTPILSAITFSDRGDMILTLMDRSGHQWGFNNRRFLETNTSSINYISSGDIIMAGLNCNSGLFAMENDGTVTTTNGVLLTGAHVGGVISFANPNEQGIGGKEFFYDDSNVNDPHQETVTGGSALLKGFGEVIVPAFAVSLENSDAGSIKLSTTDGDYVPNSAYVLYNTTSYLGASGKANGLGDIEISGPVAPIEIGNRIWSDSDSDGIQDAGEAGINGVNVKLFEGATEVASVTTSNGGQYYFKDANVAGGIKYNTNYEIRIVTNQSALNTLSLTTTDVGSSDLIDNDGTTSGANVIKSFTTQGPGANNHSYDFGFKQAAPCVTPTGVFTQTAPTCTGSTPNNNGKITLSSVTNGTHYGVSTGATYTGPTTIAGATAISGTLDVQTAIPNTGGTYTIRIFNTANDCFADQTIVVSGITCFQPPCPFTPSIVSSSCHSNATENTSFDDYITFLLKPHSDLTMAGKTYSVTAMQGGNPVGVTLSDGTSASGIYFGYDNAFKTATGTAGQGDIILTLTASNGCATSRTLTLTDPGSCSKIAKECVTSTVVYSYRTPFQPTDLDFVPLKLPKFDDLGGTRTLTSVVLTYGVGLGTNVVSENRSETAATSEIEVTGDAMIDLGANNLLSTSLPLISNGEQSYSANVIVPAGTNGSSWPGDILSGSILSTVPRMLELGLENYLLSIYVDPTLSNSWVTNITGLASTDDDIRFLNGSTAVNGNTTFSTPATVAQFIGTGLLPLTASTLTGLTTIGGGGNLLVQQHSKAYAEATVTYTFFTDCCTPPIGLSLSQTAPTCNANVINNDRKIILNSVSGADKFGISTGSTYSGTPNYAAATVIGSLPQEVLSGIPNVNGIYTIRLYNGGESCFKDTTFLISSIPVVPGNAGLPIVTFPAQVVCTNSTGVQLSTTVIPSGGAYSYAWAPNDGSLNSTVVANPNVTSLTLGIKTYTVTVTNITNLCSASASNTLTVENCPVFGPCNIQAVFLQQPCKINGTLNNNLDDYFTISVTGSTTTPIAGGKYEVILVPSGQVLNVGGTPYGQTVIVGTPTTFLSNGTSTYSLRIRNFQDPSCQTQSFTTQASPSCSNSDCTTPLYQPFTTN